MLFNLRLSPRFLRLFPRISLSKEHAMKIKNLKIKSAFALSLGLFSLSVGGVSVYRHFQATKSALPTDPLARLRFVNEAFAEGDATCSAIQQEAWAGCFDKNTKYTHGALNYFNNTLCMLNNGFPSAAEAALCHFRKSMEINPDKGALPFSVTKTFGGKTIKVDIAAPTETFATTAGYDAKGVVTVNDVTFMTIYWGGKADASKGFLINGGAGLGGDSKKRPLYVQWSREDATAQFVKVFSANFTTSYLGTVGRGSKTSPDSGDRALYGEATFNATSKSATAQVVLIEGQRGAGTATTPACFRMFANGTKDGTVTVAKTKDALSTTGDSVTSTYTDSTNMDAFQGTDSVDTANGTGNLGTGQFGGMTISFSKSCNDISTAGSTGGAFAGNDVSHSATPDDIF